MELVRNFDQGRSHRLKTQNNTQKSQKITPSNKCFTAGAKILSDIYYKEISKTVN